MSVQRSTRRYKGYQAPQRWEVLTFFAVAAVFLLGSKGCQYGVEHSGFRVIGNTDGSAFALGYLAGLFWGVVGVFRGANWLRRNPWNAIAWFEFLVGIVIFGGSIRLLAK